MRSRETAFRCGFRVSAQFTDGGVYLADLESASTIGGSVVVKGLVSPAGGLFNATIDGTITSQLDSFSPWIVRTELFFLTGLDPTKPHTLMLANAQPGTTLQLQSIEVSSPGNGEP